jgi:hypothetical protein
MTGEEPEIFKDSPTNNSWAKLGNNRVDRDYESGDGLIYTNVRSA